MSNEFSDLNDLALGLGIKHSELISAIHEEVLKEYHLRYPDGVSNVSVIVDEQSGVVHLMDGSKDVTPDDFSPIASGISRQVIISKMKNAKEQGVLSNNSPMRGEDRSMLAKWIVFVMFWGYNGLFIVLSTIYLFAFVTDEPFRNSSLEGLKSLGVFRNFALLFLLLAPIFSMSVAVKAKLTENPLQLGKLLFLFEIPFIFILFTAISSFSDVIPSMWFFLLMIVVTFFVFLLNLAKVDSTPRLWLKTFFLTLQEVSFLTVTYLTFLYSFFVPLVIGGFIKEIGSNVLNSFSYGLDSGEIIIMLIVLVMGILGAAFFAILIVAPYFISYLLFKYLRTTHLGLRTQFSRTKVWGFHSALVLIYIVILGFVSYQPSVAPYLERLDQLGKAATFEQKQEIARELSPHAEEIKRGVADMSNAYDRYFMVKSDDTLSNLYQNIYGVNVFGGEAIQTMFSSAAYPFVYQGDLKMLSAVRENYQYLFGDSISENEYDYTPLEPQDVTLVSRKTSVLSDYQNLLATVQIEEEYANTSWGNEEVVYEFSLPEGSVISDLKLGPNLEFAGVVAPKGAASSVYQQQIVVRKDPALLEQTGPRQYRLRIFPIPAKGDVTLGGKNQKVQFSYVTGITAKGFGLPVYSRKINIQESSAQLESYLNNQKIASTATDSFIAIPNQTNLCDFGNNVSMKNPSGSVSAQLVPIKNIEQIKGVVNCNQNSGVSLSKGITGKKIAVLYDVSYDNRENTFIAGLKESINADPGLLERNAVDYYLFNELMSIKNTVTKEWAEDPKLVYFGKSDISNTLQKFNENYDLIIIATTKNEIASSVPVTLKAKVPYYIAHNGNVAPAYPSVLTNSIIQNGGGVVTSFDNALNSYLLRQRLFSFPYVSHAPFMSVYLSGYAGINYSTQESSGSAGLLAPKTDEPLTYVANSGFLMDKISYTGGNLETDLFTTDAFNRFAQKAHIVSPFSSMIALVNDAQRNALNNASESSDRYSYQAPPVNTSQTFGGRPLINLNNAFVDSGSMSNGFTLPTMESGGSTSGGINLVPGRPAQGMAAPQSFSSGFGSSSGMGIIMLFLLANGVMVGIAGLIFGISKFRRNGRKKG